MRTLLLAAVALCAACAKTPPASLPDAGEAVAPADAEALADDVTQVDVPAEVSPAATQTGTDAG